MAEVDAEYPDKLIAIGTSAGGLEPLQIIMSNLPQNIGSASIIVAQHLSPHYKSMMRDLLARKTILSVEEITNNMVIMKNTIYTIPPDNDVVVENKKFRLLKPEKIGPKPSINKLLKSVAENFGSKSIGIILSGTGTDGSEGIAEVKRKGGITIVQEPNTAKYDGMPQAAIGTGKIDYIIPPEEIGHYFNKLVGRVRNFKDDSDSDGENDQMEESVSRVLSLLEENSGTDFSNYKTSTIYRRLEKRLNDTKFSSIDQYLSFVQNNEEELHNLFKYLLIGVTAFFRDPDAYNALEKHIEQSIINRKTEKNFRIWVPGCASGEEAYSLAILTSEIISKLNIPDYTVQVFATDIDQKALNKARAGIYSSAAMENVPDNIKQNYFRRKGNNFEVVKHIRQMVLFTRHDLTTNPPFLKIDLLSCRNLLIYFNHSLQNHVMPIFHYALKPEGLLFLGKSESIGNFSNYFSTIDSKRKIFKSRINQTSKINLPHLKPIAPARIPKSKKTPKDDDFSLHEMIKETIFNTYEFPYVIVDDRLEMVEIFGDVSPFLKVKSGIANTNLLKMLSDDLQMELRSVAANAFNVSKSVRGNLRKVEVEGKDYFLRFTVKPLMFSKPVNAYFMVIFEKIDIDEKLFRNREVVYQDSENPQVIEMEHELISTREHMTTLVEELETSNEELQALNEELQSSNEELQASNEELETSNEELQASNEELDIAYTELRAANEEVRKQAEELKISENKLQTLFNSALQGFIMLDSNYGIITFNKTAATFFKQFYKKQIVEGQSYIDLIPHNQVEAFLNNFKSVIKGKSVTHESEILSENGTKYLQMTLTPVLSSGDTDKILISFIDISARKEAEKDLLKAHEETLQQRELWQQLTLLSPALIAVIDHKTLKYKFVNPAFQEFLPKQDIIGKMPEDLFKSLPNKAFVDLLRKAQTSGKIQKAQEELFIFNPTNKNEFRRYFNFTYAPLKNSGDPSDIIFYATDVTTHVEQRVEIEKAHQQVAFEKNKLESILSSAPFLVAVLEGSHFEFNYVNSLFEKAIGKKKLSGKQFKDLVPGPVLKKYKPLMDRVIKTGSAENIMEVNDIFENISGKKYFNIILQPFFDHKKTKGLILFAYDVSEQVEIRKTIEANVSFMNTLNDSMPQKVWTADPKGKYDYLNKPMTKYLGLTDGPYSDFTKVEWYRFIHPDDRKKTSEVWQKSLTEGNNYKVEHRLKNKNGNYKWHLSLGLPLKNEQNEIIKWVGTSTDIDEQKKTEQLKDQFLSIASHELKTPLTTVLAYTDLLHERTNQLKDEEVKVYIEKSSQNLEKLNHLINDLLDISRLEGGRFHFEKTIIDFDQVVMEGVENVRHTCKTHKIVVTGSSNKKVSGDFQRLEQVIMNLLSNAIKYSPNKEEIRVNIGSNGKEVLCEVLDDGIGIPVKHLHNIFERYYRAHENHHYISGLGIGLFITRQIVERHGGRIFVESKEGEGSKFFFTLPIADI